MRIPTRRLAASFMVALAVAMSGLPAAPSPVRAAGTITALAIDSDPGDAIGGGLQFEYLPPTTTFSIYTHSPSWTFLQVAEIGGSDFWNLSFRAPGTDTLAVGTYENTLPMSDATHAGLDIGGHRGFCNTSTGRFVVDELERDATGTVTTLAVSFEQHCSGDPAALFGELRYQASSGYPLLTVAPASIDLGSAGVGSATPPQTVHLTSDGIDNLTLSGISIGGANAADFAIASANCGVGQIPPHMTCDIAIRATPRATGVRTGQLVIGNDTFRGERRVDLRATGLAPVSKVGWATTRSGPSYSYNLGQSLARSVSSSATYLHATYTTDRVSGAWVDDNGPYAGINYVRTSNRGSTFTTPKRLNSSKQHGSRGSLAASGKYVYATWVSTTRWIAYRPTAPRVLYLRRNSNHGARTAWNTTKRLTSLTGRVDFPTVAAAGANVYVVYTDSATGSVKVKISRDRAATWKTVTIGSTASSTASGRYGIPRIAASGNTVVVAWLANGSGAVKARVSTNAGRTWSATGGLTGTSTDIPAVAALGARAAVAWTDGSSAVVRTWSAGAWSSPRSTGRPAAFTQSYGAAIALSGSAGIGVAWTGCVTTCETWSPATRANLVWSESRDGGASWFAGQVIGSSSASSARRYNDYPSILWPSATVRHVLWNAGTAGTNAYRIVLRTGTGQVAATAASQITAMPSGSSNDGTTVSPDTGRKSPGAP